MKVAISTLHAQHNNFGTVLQSVALKTYLESKGYDVRTVDYSPWVYKYGITDWRSFVKRWAVNLMFAPHFIIRQSRFRRFIKEYNAVTSKRYFSFRELVKDPPQADIYIAGSDQIWNPRFPCGRDDTFYLKYVDSPNKMSYASSTGTADLTSEDYEMLLGKISEFRFVSVRELEAKNRLRQLGRQDVVHVCDPVALLTKEQYREMSRTVVKGPYILVYAINRDPVLAQVVNTLSTATQLQVVAIGGFSKKCRSDVFFRSCGPREFLGLMNHATYVVTSSFHGVMFSLIFEKQFFVVEPAINKLRLRSILDITMTGDRVVTDPMDLCDLLEKPIDYGIVQQRFSDFIDSSKRYLDNCLSYFSGCGGDPIG